MFSLKHLARKLGLPPSKLVKDLTIKHRKKLFSKHNGVWYEFKSAGDVIVPYDQARDYAASIKKNLRPPIDVHRIRTDHLTSDGLIRLPVVVLLGHFNHGKTTLLDAIGGSAFVDEEKHGITQIIRTQLIPSVNLTIVDTPGQEVFYRMRSYGASIADIAVVMVAADDGVCLQTEESVGIVEELKIPAVVCVNKVDLPEVTPQRIESVLAQIDEFVALANAPVLQISAKTKFNLDALLAKLAEIGKRLSSSSPLALRSTDELQDDYAATDSLLIVATGTVLNIVKSRQQGNSLHVIVRHGEVRPGDWFSAGGWCGSVRSIQQSCIPTSLPSSNLATGTNGKNSKTRKKQKGKAKEASVPTFSTRASVNADVSSAGPGMAVSVLITLHDEINEPRPIGDTIRFHRDASKIKRELKAQWLAASTESASLPTPEGALNSAAPLQVHSLVPQTAVRGNVIAEPALRPVLADKFLKAKEAAEYCMERSQLDVMLAAHAITPETAVRIGLEKLCHLFERQKIGFRGKAKQPHRVINIKAEENDDNADLDGTEGSDFDDEYDDEKSFDSDDAEDEVLGDDDYDNDDDGVGEKGLMSSIIVKADSDVTLGTLVDKFNDVQTELQDMLSEGEEALPAINNVIHWGIGEVGWNDVNMASAADALIVAYNVGVEKSAARQALNVNVEIKRFDHIQEAAKAIVGKEVDKYLGGEDEA